MVRNIITDLCHHLEIGIDGNLDIGNKKVIVGTPAITLIGNTFTISCSTSNVNIYYTLDGSTPTSNSIRYTSAVTLSNNCTIKAIAIKGNKYSAIAEETYIKPITYLTQWKIAGNSEVHDNEIWSCGEYNATDGKYHILIQPLGGSIADIALTEPLRKVNNVADTIEFPSGTEGKALVTRNTGAILVKDLQWQAVMITTNLYRMLSASVPNAKRPINNSNAGNVICPKYNNVATNQLLSQVKNLSLSLSSNGYLSVIELPYSNSDNSSNYIRDNNLLEFIYELATSTTELVDAPQIEEADSYSCVISQSGKAISWFDFITDKEQLYAYGVQWDKNDSNPDVTRIGNMEYHALLPIQSQMRGCLLDDNGNVTKYLTQEDWNLSTLGDETHQVMIELPEFWWKFVKNGNTRKVLMSAVALNGYTRVPKMYVSAYEATIDRGNAEGTGATSTWKLASVKNNSPRFRGGNNDRSKDSAYNTLLQMPATNISLTEYRTYARRRKANSSEWNLYTFQIHKILYWLFVVEYATRNSQKAINNTLTAEGYHQGGLGNGPTNANDSNWNSLFSYYPFIPIGTSDSLGNNTGQVAYASLNDSSIVWCNTQSNRYRGIENPFGHIWKWVDGIHVQVESGENGESKVYVTDNPSLWQDSNNNNYNYVGNETRVNSYVNDILFDDGNIICINKQASSGQYYCDYHYVNIPTAGSNLRAVRFGGRAVENEYAGFVCSSAHHAPSERAATIGSRLCFVPNI